MVDGHWLCLVPEPARWLRSAGNRRDLHFGAVTVSALDGDGTRGSFASRLLIDDLTVEDRHLHAGLLDVHWVDMEDVIGKHD